MIPNVGKVSTFWWSQLYLKVSLISFVSILQQNFDQHRYIINVFSKILMFACCGFDKIEVFYDGQYFTKLLE